jgi:hypothetical protein
MKQGNIDQVLEFGDFFSLNLKEKVKHFYKQLTAHLLHQHINFFFVTEYYNLKSSIL